MENETSVIFDWAPTLKSDDSSWISSVHFSAHRNKSLVHAETFRNDDFVPFYSSTNADDSPQNKSSVIFDYVDYHNTSSLPLGYLDNLALAFPMGISLYALSLLTLVGNAMVVHAIRTERRLQTVSNIFILSLAIADMTVGLFVMPISSAYAITGQWTFGIVVCQFWLAVDYTASTSSILNLLTLSLDRYWSIRSPLKYMRKRTKRRALVMIAVVWAISSLWIVPIIGWHFWYTNGIRTQNGDVCETEFADNVPFKLTTSVANFYVPMILMICIYLKIFHEIKKRSTLEIGKCNVATGGTNSSCDYSLVPTPETNQQEDASDASPCIINGGSTPSRSLRSDNEETSSVRCNHKMFEPEFESRTMRDARFSHLTVLTFRHTNPNDASWQRQHFEGVDVTVEYVQDPCRIEQETSDKESSSRDHVYGRVLQDFESRNGVQGFEMCPIYSDRPKKRERSSHSRVSDSKNVLGSSSRNHNHNLHVPTASSFASFRGSSSRLCLRPSGSILPNIGTALRLRVTRRNPANSLSQEKKAARQLGVIIGAFVLCWLPYMTMFMVTAYCGDCINAHIHTAAIWLGYFNSTINPFLYALCNANFKRAFKKMFTRYSKHNYACATSISNRADLYA